MRRLRTPKSNGYEALRVLSRTVNSGRLNILRSSVCFGKKKLPLGIVAKAYPTKMTCQRWTHHRTTGFCGTVMPSRPERPRHTLSDNRVAERNS